MVPISVRALEGWIWVKNRVFGIGWHRDPYRHFGPGGLEEAEALCTEAGRDFLGFVRPPATLEAKDLEAYERRPAPSRRSCVVLRFDSPLPSGQPRNDRVEVRVYHPPGGNGHGRVMLFHHPVHQNRWRMWEWFLSDLMDRVPVAILASPYHFDRTPVGQYSGEGMVNPNPWRIFESLRQWCWDEKATLSALRSACGLEPAGVVGYSMGAFQALLLASAGELELPIACIAATNRYAWGVYNGSMGHGLQRGLREAGIDRARFERMVEPIELERYVGRIRPRPILLVAGRYDSVDPPPSTERLERALRPSRSLQVEAGHASLFIHRQAIFAEVLRFFDERGGLP